MTRLLPVLVACLAFASLAPSATADHLPPLGGTVDCMDYYKATHVAGPYWLLQRDSCHAELYECPDGAVPPAAPCQEVGVVATAAAPSIGFPTCVPIAVGSLCFSPYWPGCNLWVQWTAIPLQDSCLYRSDPLMTGASVGPESTPDVQCMDVYSATNVPGTGYWIVRKDSCSLQVYECPAGSAPPSASCHELELFTTRAVPGIQAPPIYCMPYERELALTEDLVIVQGGCGSYVRLCGDRVTPDRIDTSCLTDDLTAAARPVPPLPPPPPIYCSDIYARHEVGPVAVVMTSGCSGHVELCDETLSTRPDTSCVLAQAASQEPMCMYYYYEAEVGPVRYVQRDSCHSELYVCGQDVKDPIAVSPGPGNPGACLPDGVDELHLDGVAAQPLPPLPPVGDPTQRQCFRYGQFELWSVYCIQPDDPDCLVYYQQITGQGSSWWCYPSGEHGSDI